MKAKLTCTILILLLVQILQAKKPKPYEWEKTRSRYVLTEKEKSFAEYILKFHSEYNFEWDGDKLVLYRTIHQITRVTNEESIQRFNRIQISMRNAIELVELKARVINKDGRIVNFDRNNLKEVKDEETGAAYRIFAIEGVESDSELEYYYTVKLGGKLFETVYMEGETPVKQCSFFMTSPLSLIFEFKTYNDSSAVKADTAQQENQYALALHDIPGRKKENFSYWDANRKRVEFKLAYNTTASGARLNTWADAAKAFYKTLSEGDNDSERAIERYTATLKDNPSASQLERIKRVEDQVKRTIQVNRESSDPALGNIPSILKYKQASTEGLTHLFFLVFAKLNIPVHIVVTCSREEAKFDASFDSWAYLDDYLLFFPGTKGFIAPGETEFRYPVVPAKLTAQEGLFIEPITIGEVKSALASIGKIPELPYSFNTDNLDISVAFNADKTSNTITLKRDFSGYNAAAITQYYDVMTAEQKLKFIEELIKETVPDPNIIKWSASSSSVGEIIHFVVEVSFITEHFLEKAGTKLLFKAGELIGPQVEMYRDNERRADVENVYNRSYERTIRIALPEGYAPANSDDLKIRVEYAEGDRVPFLFHSDYSRQGSNLTIAIKEYYKDIFAPLSRYEDFRKVINASADFNKVTLVLEPK